MAWYSDEEYVFRKDCGEKKSVAASSHKQRTHCGKGGRVKFPSDFMTKKERNSMNGECVSYKLGEPMTWDEFKALPEELKKEYIQKIREKFNAPNTAIADMLGCNRKTLGLYLADLKLDRGAGGPGVWDEEGFKEWVHSEDNHTDESVVEPSDTDIEIQPMSWDKFKALSTEEKNAYLARIREIFKANDKAIAEMFGISSHFFSKALHAHNLESSRSLGGPNRKWDIDKFRRWAFPTEYIIEDREAEKIAEVGAEDREAEKIVEAAIEETPVVEPSETVCEAPEAPVSESQELIDNCLSEVMEDVQKLERAEEVNEYACIDLCCDTESEHTPCAIPNNGSMNFECEADRALATLQMLLGNSKVKLKVEWEVVE